MVGGNTIASEKIKSATLPMNSGVNNLPSDHQLVGQAHGKQLARKVVSKHTLAALALCIATLATYLPAIKFDFLNYDDQGYVTENPHVLGGLTARSIRWAFTSAHASNWHPVTWLSHMLDIELFGHDPAGPHLINVLLHTANALLVLVVLTRMTGRFLPGAFAAAFFALHPLRVESVAWVAERKDVLSTFFGLLTLFFYWRYTQAHGSNRGHQNVPNPNRPTKTAAVYYGTALLCFALGLMAKPMLVTWPFLMLLLDYWPLTRFGTSGLSRTNVVAKLIVEKLPFFVLTLASSLVTYIVQKQGGAVQTWLPMWARLENAFVSYARYIGKVVWPVNLAVPYPHPGEWPGSTVLLATLFVVGVSVLVWLKRRERPYAFVGWFGFTGTLVPVIGLVQVGQQAIADRYTYFPSIGLFMILCWGIAELIAKWPRLKPVAVTGALLAVAGLTVRTSIQLRYWRNTETLFTHSIKCTTDNADALGALGNYKLKLGQVDDALGWFERALHALPGVRQTGVDPATLFLSTDPTNAVVTRFRRALKSRPTHADAYAELLNNYGYALASKGQSALAMEWYRAALEIKPDYPLALHNLAVELSKQRNYSNAIELYTAALAGAPDDPKIHLGLATALKAVGKFADAIPHYERALAAFPTDASVHEQLGICMAETGRLTDAIKHYRTALELNPRSVAMRNNLGAALLSLGQYDAAIEQLKAAIELNPAYASAYENLGVALAAKGEYDDAVENLRKAIDLDPATASTHLNLGNILAQQNKLRAAAAKFRSALMLEPGNALAHCALAGVLMQLGETNDAIKHAQKALELAPDLSPAKEILRLLEQESH